MRVFLHDFIEQRLDCLVVRSYQHREPATHNSWINDGARILFSNPILTHLVDFTRTRNLPCFTAYPLPASDVCRVFLLEPSAWPSWLSSPLRGASEIRRNSSSLVRPGPARRRQLRGGRCALDHPLAPKGKVNARGGSDLPGGRISRPGDRRRRARHRPVAQ